MSKYPGGTRDLGAEVKARLSELTFALGGPDTRDRIEKLRPVRNEFGVDPFGFDTEYLAAAAAPFVWLYRNYFRVQVRGIENVPSTGRVILVGNHSGQLPFDAVMLILAVFLEAETPRITRMLVEKWAQTLPFVSTVFARAGQVVGTPDNCRRLLAAEEALGVFPEGVRGLNKLYRDRYRLRAFGQGFMRLALEARAPIVPVGIVGAEEQAPALFNASGIARLLGWPAFPITPTVLPVPLPSRYHIRFGPPLHFTGEPDDEDAVLSPKVEAVRSAVQALVDRGLAERTGVFW